MAASISVPERIFGRGVLVASSSWSRAAYLVSVLLATVSAAGAAATFFVPGVLRGPAVMNGSARCTALVMLVVGLPALLLSIYFAAGGSQRARIFWLGTIGYFAYNGVMFVIGTPFNQLYLLYEAMLGLSIWAGVLTVVSTDRSALSRAFARVFPDRPIAAYLVTIVAANTLVWLGGVVPGVLSSSSPKFLEGTGLTTLPTYDQDLAFWLPSIAVAAVWMWRGMFWGRLIAGAALVIWVIEAVGVAVDQWMGGAADPTSNVASASVTPMFAVLALVGMVPLYFYMRALCDRADGS